MIDIPGNIPEYSVSEISTALRLSVELAFDHVRVRGEVSRLARPKSGHLYFRLKDENAVIEAICWRGVSAKLRYLPEDGLEMICTGRLTTYPGRSQYQIIVDHLEPAGEGAMLKLLEDRRKALAGEGLFDETRKQPLPYLPEVIGVVTSPTGAVIRDILHRFADRFPRPVLLWPVTVQGDAAAGEIANAITGFNRIEPSGLVPRPDLLIVARGGGSLEDLWPFNEEIVVRAAAASAIPLISAIGHETDSTLIDFAADQRAPTPTAAAEIAVPQRSHLIARLLDLDSRLISAVSRNQEAQRGALRSLERGLPRDPRRLLEGPAQRLDNACERLSTALRLWVERQRARIPSPRSGPLRGGIMQRRATLATLPPRLRSTLGRGLDQARERLTAQARLLEGFGFEQVLARGFVLLRDNHGAPVVSATAAKPGTALELTFHDGTRGAVINGKSVGKNPPAPAGNQGDLF